MAWDQLWINKPHLAYAIVGGFITLFSLVSLFIKERLYIGEATVASICGIIFGPHCLNWFNPLTWGNTDDITLELSRIVLVVQIFAVAVELPKKYMLRHWLSVFILLVPVMAIGWVIGGLCVWAMVPTLSWKESLLCSACVTATDPVLASAVVGKGKFAKRVPGHLRNVLSAESGCNDGMAYPFIYISLLMIRYDTKTEGGEIAKDWFCLTVLYECIFGCVLGTIIGYVSRHLVKFAESHNLIDRESFLVIYFTLAVFCAGIGTIIGVDDLLVSFAAGAAFAWDGWFARKTEESHVSNVIDLLLNMSFFVYFGSIVPWQAYQAPEWGLYAWRLVILAILVLLLRRIPAVLLFKPLIPDIRSWREALFCGHFGPIGVGAIFACIIARAELEHGEPTPLAELPPPGSENYIIVETIWPIVTFLIVASIVVHGSSIAVFTLGKHINTMAITMSYTTGNKDGPSWLSRLPRVDTGKSLSIRKVDTTEPSFFNLASRMRNRRSSSVEPNAGGGTGSTSSTTDYDEKYPARPGRNYSHTSIGSLDSETLNNKKYSRHRNGFRKNSSEVLNNSNSQRVPHQMADRRLNGTPLSQKHKAEQQIKNGNVPDEIDLADLPAGSRLEEKDALAAESGNADERTASHNVEAYEEGDHLIFENRDGEVIGEVNTRNDDDSEHKTADIINESEGSSGKSEQESEHEAKQKIDKNMLTVPHSSTDDKHRQFETKKDLHPQEHTNTVLNSVMHPIKTFDLRRKIFGGMGQNDFIEEVKADDSNRKLRPVSQEQLLSDMRVESEREGTPAHLYQIGDDIFIENEDGEIMRRYVVNRHDKKPNQNSNSGSGTLEDDSAHPKSILRKTIDAFIPSSINFHSHPTTNEGNVSRVKTINIGELESHGSYGLNGPKDHEDERQEKTARYHESPDSDSDEDNTRRGRFVDRSANMVLNPKFGDKYNSIDNDYYNKSSPAYFDELSPHATTTITAAGIEIPSNFLAPLPDNDTTKDNGSGDDDMYENNNRRITFADETPAEKRRRLAALGIANPSRNNSRNNSRATSPVSLNRNLQQSNDDEDNNANLRVKWGDGV